MNSTPYPNFSEQGYRVVRELGRNREGGRITWLASDVNTTQQVVLKQFCFAQVGSSWSGFAAHQREIEILQKLTHPGIPRYISSFATSDGFCLVQEYIHAQSLAERLGDFDAEEIKRIAIKALDILRYLQNLNPPVIHRDIKPENILVDEELKVYLIDFGFARIGSQEVAGSSVFKGTPGFIPPEQMFEPTQATDLYALGTTLICLLAKIKSTEIRELCDRNNPYIIKFKPLLPQLSLRFLGWLENMVQPEQNKRFANAQAAFTALQPLEVVRVPGIDFSETVLEFKANRLGEKLTQSITVENTIPDTLLQGKWEVAPHPHDPPHTPDSHAWISVTPTTFSRNHTQFQVEVDTIKLMADKSYKRQLILHSNAYPASHTLTVKVQTAALPIEKTEVSYTWLVGVALIGAIAPLLINLLMVLAGIYSTLNWLIAFSATYLTLIWVIAFFGLWKVMKTVIGAGIGLVSGAIVALCAGGFIVVVPMVFGANYDVVNNIFRIMGIIGSVVGLVYGGFLGFVVWGKDDIQSNKDKKFYWSRAILYLLTAVLGTSFGIIVIIGFVTPYSPIALTGIGLPLISLLLYPPLKRRRLITKYRQSEESLIEP
ncbi:protein kinase [Nostoc sp. FACHB-87]|uniref:serine/threonine protein kinase n=1 Tax=Nostocaceae TaxID=1162 RepID=UPI00168A3B68|nr:MULTISPECIES: protein kinase [Nostocaceae]MBD2452666.1 protein kinase [Nostoc sp. FACHB-87]MBD2473597.1 protein kinase [Anabaena sp. FACHB-83]